MDALQSFGVRQLYEHQAGAIDAIRQRRDVAIATPTASGKTLAFNLPVLEELLEDRDARALYIYPTNALINDQARGLDRLLGRLDNAPRTAVLTGATSADDRRSLRQHPPQVLLTNPEMLHLSLLGQHRLWAKFIRGLRFIVVDEMHLYRGLFGAHMSMVLRRLDRVAALHGGRPQIVACSATVGNAVELAEFLTGRTFVGIEGSAAPRSARSVLLWRPPRLTNVLGRPFGDPQAEAAKLFSRFVSEGLGVILFAPTRRGAEAILLQARGLLGKDLAQYVAPYRSGYTPEQRQQIEERLKRGDLRGVISTNALEVGIDIGSLDVAIIAGFPGSRTSFWQQAGRAGRGERAALVVLVPYPRVIDEYYASHPRELLAGGFEDVVVDVTNRQIVAQHLACAAQEAAFGSNEPVLGLGREVVEAALDYAGTSGAVVKSERGWVSAGSNSHSAVNLRGAQGDVYQIVAEGAPLGSIDAAHLDREAYPGAVYVHNGARYRVRAIDPSDQRVHVVAEPGNSRTEPLSQVTIHAEHVAGERSYEGRASGLRVGWGALTVRRYTTGYREYQHLGKHAHVSHPLTAPLRYELNTTGTWLVLPTSLRFSLDKHGEPRFLAGLHALEHLLPSVVALRFVTDSHDMLAAYELEHPAMGGSALFLFDNHSGGAGIAVRSAPIFEDLLRASHDIVQDCTCRDGCPACIVSPLCWRQSDPIDKKAALALLQDIAPASLR